MVKYVILATIREPGKVREVIQSEWQSLELAYKELEVLNNSNYYENVRFDILKEIENKEK